jgi:hypothetical protein
MRHLAIMIVTCSVFVLGLGDAKGVESGSAASATPPEGSLQVFFIGNSHTGCNNLIRVIEKLAFQNESELDIVTAGHLVGGCTLERHWDEGNAMAKMMKGKWDFVVLQENGQGPLAYPDMMRQYARQFDDRIKQAGAKTVLFMTAAYQDYPASTETIVRVHLEIGKALDADVAPVGLAFQIALTKRPDLTLHNLPDTMHANPQGTYLTACVIWSTLTGKTPHGLSRGGLTELTDEETAFLQGIAWESIIEYRAKQSMQLGQNTTVVFAGLNEGKQILTAQDDFVRRMSPFDRAARMKTDRDISEEAYLAFVGKAVLEWNDAEKKKVSAAFQSIQADLEALSLPLPEKVIMIKTTGREEGGAAYTRANAIVFPQANLRASTANIRKTICHELFHVMSRANPDLREKLYAAIGFVTCNEVEFPVTLKSRKLTNPDAPRNDHCIHLQVEGKACWAIPILFSTVNKYDVERGGEFFNYLKFQFLLVERDNKSFTVKPIYEGQQPRLIGLKQASGFFAQVGRNTRYTIHPEEILADNFALLVLQEKNLSSPDIIEKLKDILKENRTAKP